MFIYLPNGVNTYDYQLEEEGRITLSTILAPLEPHRSQFSPISGLYHPNAFGVAHDATRTWLTGAKHGPQTRIHSVDQWMAQLTGPSTRFSSLEISNQGQPVAVSADGIALPAQASPSVVFKDLFAEPSGGVERQRRDLQRKQSVTGSGLGRCRLSRALDGTDRDRLDQYLTSGGRVELRTSVLKHGWTAAATWKCPKTWRQGLDRDIRLERLGEYLRTMYDIIALAFETDVTRVVTFNTGNEGTGPSIPEIGIRRDRPPCRTTMGIGIFCRN